MKPTMRTTRPKLIQLVNYSNNLYALDEEGSLYYKNQVIRDGNYHSEWTLAPMEFSNFKAEK